MPRILVLCEYPQLHGGENSLLAAFPFLIAAGYRLIVAAPAPSPLADAVRSAGGSVIPWSMVAEDGQKRSQPELRVILAEMVAHARPDMLHANSLSMTRLSGPVVQQLGIPSIGHLRDIVGLSATAMGDVNAHTRLLAVSEATRAFHIRQGLACDRSFVCYNGVDLTRFAPRPATGWLHRYLQAPPSSMLVAAIGQLSLRKGQDVFAQAAQLVVEHIPHAYFLIVGERYATKREAILFEESLQQTLQTPPLQGRSSLLGHSDAVCDLLPELTLLVHAARQEPLGRVLLEAAASGTPVIATDVGGTREIFDSESSAAIVPANNPDQLAAEIIHMLSSKLRRQCSAAQARRTVERNFDIRATAERLGQHYQAVLAGDL